MWQVCPNNKVNTKASRVYTTDQMLDGGFVAKANSYQGQIFYTSRFKSIKKMFHIWLI